MSPLTLLCVVVSTLTISSQNHEPKPQPNIIVIIADDLGWNDVGFNNPAIISPNIDGLARSGVILNYSYVQPMCTPSRSALMTGVYPFRYGLSHFVINFKQGTCVPLNMTFLPEVLQRNGYSTHAIGKWHLGFCNKACLPTSRGFDSFYGYYQPGIDYYTKMILGGYDFHDNYTVDIQANGTHSTYLYRNRVKQIIQNHDTSKPMFLYLAFQEVHTVVKAPKEYYDLYPHIQEEERRHLLGLVTAMDASVGELVKALRKKGLYDNTLIFFSTDNGGQVSVGGSNYPLRGSKPTIFEGGTRAVAFVHGPMLRNVGVRYDGLIHIVDWFPTILEAAGIDFRVAGQDGISQWENLVNLSPSKRNEVVYNLDYSTFPIQGQSAIRIGDYKLILGYPGLFPDWYDPSREPEWRDTVGALNGIYLDYSFRNRSPVKKTDMVYKYLFNIKDDPAEHKDIYDKEPSIVQKLKKRLEYYKAGYVTPIFPEDDPNCAPSNWGGVWSPGWC